MTVAKSKIVPTAPPEIERAALLTLLPPSAPLDFLLIGRRGYYRDSMGVSGVNDRNIYDDAIALVTPTAYVTFNANTDPSVARKGVAVLMPGVWLYKIGTHGLSRLPVYRYKALVQAADVTVARDEVGLDTGRFGINIHRGGYSTTSSLGCQTIYPPQWASFIATVESEMRRHARSVIHYVLTAR